MLFEMYGIIVWLKLCISESLHLLEVCRRDGAPKPPIHSALKYKSFLHVRAWTSRLLLASICAIFICLLTYFSDQRTGQMCDDYYNTPLFITHCGLLLLHGNLNDFLNIFSFISTISTKFFVLRSVFVLLWIGLKVYRQQPGKLSVRFLVIASVIKFVVIDVLAR